MADGNKGDATFLSRENRIVYLYGAPASGKTTLGRRLALALNSNFIDLDEAIAHQAGLSIAEIFQRDGEARFRELEAACLATVVRFCEGKDAPVVVSLGGGTLLSDENRALCEKSGTVVCIETPSEEELARRLGAAAGTRPLGDRAKERAAHYASFPNRIAAWFDLEDSLVVVGQGIAPVVLASRTGRAPTPGPVTAVVADETVARLWLHDAGREGTPGTDLVATIPSGEVNKTIETVVSLWSAFARAGLGRRDSVVAVGGGVTGDLTGFAAATFMRGIDWINVPTTLLAMTDASTGGKTGCDLEAGKNLAGAFHAPKLVVIDADFLKTLRTEILRAGKAEMIKHALIGGRATYPFDKCVAAYPPPQGSRSDGYSGAPTPAPQGENPYIPTPAEIAANLAVKIDIVRKDPFEKTGERLKLNCGHTVGHAVEKLSNYKVSHGDAVAIGCVEEARLAAERGLCAATWPEEVVAAFSAEGLPTELPKKMDWTKLVPVMRGDKKRAGSVVTFALPCGWGDVRAVPIDLEKGAS